MTREFEIIKSIIQHNRGLVIFARHLGVDHDFSIPNGSKLGDLKIYSYKEIGHLHDEHGNERLDIFVFRPVEMEDFFDYSLKIGDKVLLTTAPST